ncbi:MAG: ATPase [Desulfurococcales archaeon ex4484_58]|nr:MAG: ATPase [Desulfurococcales archaeon ex4484_58]
MRILVVGLLPYDSGKTEFVLALGEKLKEQGYRPGYFKPVAGHDGWYQYDTLLYSRDEKLLIGHDAYLVSERFGLTDILYLVSPLDLLTLPVDPVKPGMTIRSYIEHMSLVGKRAVLLRYTRVFNDKSNYKHLYFICNDTLAKLNNELRSVYEDLVMNFKNSNSLFIETNTNSIEKMLSSPAIYGVIDSYIEFFREYEPVIIEGYNDVAAPTIGSLNVDYVFLIGPGKAIVYSGERYRTAVELLSYRGYPWMIKSTTVFDLLGKPLRTYDIPLKVYVNRYHGLFENIAEFIMGGDNYYG